MYYKFLWDIPGLTLKSKDALIITWMNFWFCTDVICGCIFLFEQSFYTYIYQMKVTGFTAWTFFIISNMVITEIEILNIILHRQDSQFLWGRWCNLFLY